MTPKALKIHAGMTLPLDALRVDQMTPKQWYFGWFCPEPSCQRLVATTRDSSSGRWPAPFNGAGKIRATCPRCQTTTDFPAAEARSTMFLG